ncbi:hypothetical protein CDCA_CDCA18G4560 [Cyanidium caldarium]|uniref:Uncharacterized protein n=1 Tax=Cyanidium caldarium TaxID=2771 RepID=A0AAV9J1S9_CYACA|nr:hypothetical protein CDCA_CDCA18G4560 [Cyanidium caldarium]|eukprot:ctg_2653.g573
MLPGISAHLWLAQSPPWTRRGAFRVGVRSLRGDLERRAACAAVGGEPLWGARVFGDVHTDAHGCVVRHCAADKCRRTLQANEMALAMGALGGYGLRSAGRLVVGLVGCQLVLLKVLEWRGCVTIHWKVLFADLNPVVWMRRAADGVRRLQARRSSKGKWSAAGPVGSPPGGGEAPWDAGTYRRWQNVSVMAAFTWGMLLGATVLP